MTKRVLFYSRYSTDRQDAVSIEQQNDVGEDFVRQRGWTLVATYSDHAVSGTSLKTRPGIQKLLKHAKNRNEQIDIVLCVTVDRISRDVEHSAKISKDLNFLGIELWTVHGQGPVKDMEIGLRAILSQEMIEQIRYRTRMGMKKAVEKGRSAGGLAYGYRPAKIYDERGDRIAGHLEVDQDEAKIIREIFSKYAEGISPSVIAQELNARSVLGPKGEYWRDTAIRGHGRRGTGILNNEKYRGVSVWNRRNFKKHPTTEQRVARHNDESEWTIVEAPELRIVDDALWERVKRQQQATLQNFIRTTTNRLNRSHRPQYMLSGLLECSVCGGPYAIMSKDRYGCTNHRKKLPIDHLDREVCPNSKTITRYDLESRILIAVPGALFDQIDMENLVEIIKARHKAKIERATGNGKSIEAELAKIAKQQDILVDQMLDSGDGSHAAFRRKLDALELRRNELLALQRETAPADKSELDNIDSLNSHDVRLIWNKAFYYFREHVDDDVRAPIDSLIRMLISKIVVGPAPGHEPATLEVYGRLVALIAAMDIAKRRKDELDTLLQYKIEHAHYAEKRTITPQIQKKLLDECIEELSMRTLDVLPVEEQLSVVAGAGFEPAAFRL